MPEKLKEEYLDINKGIQSEILSTTRSDENSDLSTTYLGRQTQLELVRSKWKKGFPHQNKGTQ